MAKQKKHTFRSKKSEREFMSFIDQHVENILGCADLNHYYCKRKSLIVDGARDMGMSMVSDTDYNDFELAMDNAFCSLLWEQKNYRELIRFVCHEVAHIVVEEINQCVEKFKTKGAEAHRHYFEKATEHTSRWLFQLYLEWHVPLWHIDMSTGRSPKLEAFFKKNTK